MTYYLWCGEKLVYWDTVEANKRLDFDEKKTII